MKGTDGRPTKQKLLQRVDVGNIEAGLTESTKMYVRNGGMGRDSFDEDGELEPA